MWQSRLLFSACLGAFVAASPFFPGGGARADGTTGLGTLGGTAADHAPGVPNTPLRKAFSTLLTGDYAAAGCGMRNLGYCSIAISNVPGGASVDAAYLVWTVLLDDGWQQHTSGVFDGSPLSGTLAGTGKDPCWGSSSSATFWADVTSLVAAGGNGTYALSQFPSGDTDGHDPFIAGSTAPMLEGASLVVIYSEPGSPTRRVNLYLGDTTINARRVTHRFGGFKSSGSASSTVSEIISDGQSNANALDTLAVNGQSLNTHFYGYDPQSAAPYSAGDLHDTLVNDVTSLVHPGDRSVDVTLDTTSQFGTKDGDCVVWSGEVFSTPSTP